MAGPIALVGSGEYTDAMLDVDKHLLDGRTRRYVQIPTAAAPEGDGSLNHWISLGVQHAEKLDAEPVPLVVRTREDAENPAFVEALGDPGLIYFSGGNPLYLTETFRDTPLWREIVRLWENGTALAGCSAGAMAFGGWVPDVRHPTKPGAPGLGLVPQLRVLPHFDKFMGRMPDLLLRPFLRPKEGMRIVGIDEDTALVSSGGHRGGDDDQPVGAGGYRTNAGTSTGTAAGITPVRTHASRNVATLAALDAAEVRYGSTITAFDVRSSERPIPGGDPWSPDFAQKAAPRTPCRPP